MASDFDHSDFLFNLLLNLEHLGYGHHLTFSTNGDECAALATYWPGIGCVWMEAFDEQHLPYDLWDHRWRVFVKRWLLTTRLIQLGYNVLKLDTDVALLDDVYQYLKARPFSVAQLIYLDQREEPCTWVG